MRRDLCRALALLIAALRQVTLPLTFTRTMLLTPTPALTPTLTLTLTPTLTLTLALTLTLTLALALTLTRFVRLSPRYDSVHRVLEHIVTMASQGNGLGNGSLQLVGPSIV